MKKIAYLCILLLFVSSLSAQKKKVHVLLKNGSVINGCLLVPDSEDSVRVKAKENEWVISKNEIDTIAKHKYALYSEATTTPWFFRTEYGVLLGNPDSEEEAISFFHGTFNYHLVNNIYAGVGSGVEYYQERTFIPVFANFEYRFRPTKFTPYIFLKTGYLIPAEKQKNILLFDQSESRNLHPKHLHARGGLLINPGIGVIRMIGPNFGMSFSAAYRYHELNYSGKEEYELEQRYNRLSFSLGIIFK